MKKTTILEKHIQNVDVSKIEEISSIRCPKCQSLNTKVETTSSGGTKLVCNCCFHKDKSVNYFKLIGILAIIVIATIIFI